VQFSLLSLLARRYTQTVHLYKDAAQAGREVRADMRRVKARALEALLVSPSVAKGS
jgi:hypothetical protein